MKKITLIALITACASMNVKAGDRLLMIGDATSGGWNLSLSTEMVRQNPYDNTFKFTGFLNADKEFKFLTETAWDKEEYRNASSEPYILGEGKLQRNGTDQKFKVHESANYSITCDLDALTINVVKSDFQDRPIYHNILYLVGDATPGGWNLGDATPLYQDANNPFLFSGKVDLKEEGSFKIATNRYADFSQKFFFKDNSDAGKISEDSAGDLQWSVATTGTYAVTADISNMTISIIASQPDPVTDDRLCWYEPADASQNQEITLYFNAALGNAALKGYDGKVIMNSGLITPDNDSSMDLNYIIKPGVNVTQEQCTMKRSADNPDIYSITFTPQTYFATGADTKIKMIGMTFFSEDGTKAAGDIDGGTIFLPFKKNCGTIWYRPEKATVNDPITIYYDAAGGNGGLKGFKNTVYAHCGVITGDSMDDTDWRHSSGWCDNNSRYAFRRTSIDPDQYTLQITPASFFGLEENETVEKMAFVMRNSDGTVTGRDSDGSDIIVPFINGGHNAESVPLGKLTSWQREGNTVVFHAEHGRLIITPYNDYVIKVTTRSGDDNRQERRSLAVSANPECNFSVTESDGAVTIVTAGTLVSVSRADCHVAFTDAAGNVILSEKTGVDNSVFPRTVTFNAMNDGAFYGGGYNGQRINHDGTTLVMNNTQTGGWESSWSAPHNICVPFVASTNGYGILFDDTYRNARVMPSSSGTSYSTNSPDPIAYYYVGAADGSLSSVMENYTFLTGRQELPPYWALGYITSRYGYHSRAEAENVIKSVKDAYLPLDGIVFDLYWQGEGNSGMGCLDWYAPNWDNPRDMMSNFNDQGVKTICITEPYFTSASTNYSTLKGLGYFADDDVAGMEWLGASPVGLIDASNPDAMDWMWQFYKARTLEGVAGWWLDLGEPERHDADSHHLGGTVNQVHNEFGNLWIERVYRGYKEEFPDQRPFIMPRAGSAGMQRLSAFPWTGDINRSWRGLEAQIPALISAGMSGIGYLGSDVGGFAATHTDSNLYLRWIEMSVFSPMMRTHSTYNPEPYHDCYKDILPMVRDFLNLRYSYLPYTYTLAWENATKGTPLGRPVNFHDVKGIPASPADCSDQYLWGKDLLVAPVVSNTNSRQITFPQGNWVDLNDMRKVYKGGTTVSYDAPLGKLPHFARQGSFIPRFSQATYTSSVDIDNSRIYILYPIDMTSDGSTHGIFFDDDHTSTRSLADNNMVMTHFTGTNTATGHTIGIRHEGSYEGMPTSREYTFVIPNYSKEVNSVGDNNGKFTKAASKEAFDATHDNAYFLSADNTLHIRNNAATDTDSNINITSDTGTGVTEIASPGNTFEYSVSTGLYSYSIAAGQTASILIYDLTGKLLTEIDNLVIDGTVNQVAAPALDKGAYMSVLSVNSVTVTAIKTLINGI